MKKSLYIITGCSKGLGRALTDKLTLNPENLVLGISRSPMDEKENLLHLSLDMGNIPVLTDNLGKIFPPGEFQRIVLINNAGWIGEIAPLGKLDPQGIQSIYNINLIAPAILVNEFVKQYQSLDAEKIVINISSGAANKAIDGWSGYCGSKAGLNLLTLVAQEESKIKDLGIKYYALSPGIIDTEMQNDIRSSSLDDFSRGESFRSYKSKGELSSPKEVADKILELIKNSRNYNEILQDVRTF
jgi:benzil reductase ((S)-benzoin forming)